MKRTMQLEQSVLQDVVALLDNKKALRKLQSYILTLKKEEETTQEEMSAVEKEEIMNDIREGLQELKLAKQGKLRSRPVAELINEL